MTDEKHTSVAGRLLGANLAWIAAGCLLGTTPYLAAQDARTGVSVPQPVLSDSSETPAATPPAKPSAAVPLPAAQSASPDVYGAYVPYHAPGTTPAGDTSPSTPFDPDASIVTEQSIHHRPLTSGAAASQDDPDANIVTHVPTHPGELSESTPIRVRLNQSISTVTTQPGSRFTALIAEPVTQNGRVYIPEGSTLEGRITSLHGGRRIGGGASIHLEANRVTLPDGTIYPIHARVIDTSSWQNTRVDDEGTIIRREDLKGVVEAGGLATGGAIAAGALIAGVPGALVGAGVGAGTTAIVWFKQDRQARLPKDLGVIFSLTAPLSVNSHADIDTGAHSNSPGE